MESKSTLTMTGRTTLCKYVIEALPIYSMMSSKMHITCLKEIQKCQRLFIQGDTAGNNHIHTINWIKIVNHKQVRGLGMRNLKVMNKAGLEKIGGIILKKKTLWGVKS